MDLLARIEKAKAEELKAKQAAAALPDADVREELDRWLDQLAERIRQAEAGGAEVPTLRSGDYGTENTEKPVDPAGPGVH